MNPIEQYAEQCVAERLARQITDDVLSFAEFDEDELEDILRAAKNG